MAQTFQQAGAVKGVAGKKRRAKNTSESTGAETDIFWALRQLD
jgi:hypothetical protein